jgi:hypothetical protein
MRRSRRCLALVALASSHCSSPPPEAPPAAPAPPELVASSEPAKAAAAIEPAAAPVASLPGGCAPAAEKGMCVPDAAFVERLCSGDYPDVALALLAKGTPWTRAYVARSIETWDGAGHGRARVKLVGDEEVLVLEHHAAPEGGIQMSGMTDGWRVMRWDGRCAKLEGQELSLRPRSHARAAQVAWKYLDSGTKDALLGDHKIRSAYEGRQKECKASENGPSKRCERLEAQLSWVVVEYLRGGGKIPEPPRRP